MRIAECRLRNERGIALLIALLVTALLVALVFEFFYATRVSLRAAVNFRDGQRAELLARSGVNAFIKWPQLLDNTKEGEWTVVPIVSSGDTELRIRWTDEQGKIPIGGTWLYNKDVLGFVSELFTNMGVDQKVLDAITEEYKSPKQIQLLGELHRFMSDEDYSKVSKFLTASSAQMPINVNTASDEVLKSLGVEPTLINTSRPYASGAAITGIDNIKAASGLNINQNYLKNMTSSIYTVESYATVGEYTKQVTAIVDLSSGRFSYWRSM